MAKVRYEAHMYEAEVIAICTNCTRSDCPGICDAYRDAFRAARGMGPMRRYPEKLGTPKEHRVATPRRERPKQALRYSGHRWNQPVEAFGQRRTLKEWAKSAGMSYNMLYNRLYRGATLEEALSTEPRRICVPEYIEVDGVRHTVREVGWHPGREREVHIQQDRKWVHAGAGGDDTEDDQREGWT